MYTTTPQPSKTFKIIIIVLILLAILSALTSCGPTASDSIRAEQFAKDSVTFAVFRARDVFYGGKPEAVYIDTNELGAYQVGDTIEVNSNHVIPGAKSNPYTWHWVILEKRLNHNRVFSRDQAESQQ